MISPLGKLSDNDTLHLQLPLFHSSCPLRCNRSCCLHSFDCHVLLIIIMAISVFVTSLPLAPPIVVGQEEAAYAGREHIGDQIEWCDMVSVSGKDEGARMGRIDGRGVDVPIKFVVDWDTQLELNGLQQMRNPNHHRFAVNDVYNNVQHTSCLTHFSSYIVHCVHTTSRHLKGIIIRKWPCPAWYPDFAWCSWSSVIVIIIVVFMQGMPHWRRRKAR